MSRPYQGMEELWAAQRDKNIAAAAAEDEAKALADAAAGKVDVVLAIIRAGLTEQARDNPGFALDRTSNPDLFVARGIVDLRHLAARILHGRQL